MLLLAVILVFLNGFFVLAEFSLVKVRPTRIDQLVEEGNGRARLVQRLQRHLDAYLSACQVGITVTSLGLGWLGEPAVARLIRPAIQFAGITNEAAVHTVAFIVAFLLVTSMHIVYGEMAPKSLAVQKAERMALWAAGPLHAFYVLFYPLIWALNGLSLWSLRAVGVRPATEADLAHTEEELRMVITESHRSGHLDETEREFLENVFDFSERVAREVMVPRGEMICFYVEDDLEETVRIARQAGHTRYPLCEEDKDHILGIVHIKDLLGVLKYDPQLDLRTVALPALRVPETISISRLLRSMQRERAHMAILVDEYGGTAGLVTLEDLIEEIVGDIQDEFDEEEPEVEAVAGGAYEVDGGLLLDEFQERFGVRLEMNGIDTLGGYIFNLLGRPPEVGDAVELGDYRAEVVETDGLRIERVRLKQQTQAAS